MKTLRPLNLICFVLINVNQETGVIKYFLEKKNSRIRRKFKTPNIFGEWPHVSSGHNEDKQVSK